MSVAYRSRRWWEARSYRERTTLLVVLACLLYVAIALTANLLLPAGEGLP